MGLMMDDQYHESSNLAGCHPYHPDIEYSNAFPLMPSPMFMDVTIGRPSPHVLYNPCGTDFTGATLSPPAEYYLSTPEASQLPPPTVPRAMSTHGSKASPPSCNVTIPHTRGHDCAAQDEISAQIPSYQSWPCATHHEAVPPLDSYPTSFQVCDLQYSGSWGYSTPITPPMPPFAIPAPHTMNDAAEGYTTTSAWYEAVNQQKASTSIGDLNGDDQFMSPHQSFVPIPYSFLSWPPISAVPFSGLADHLSSRQVQTPSAVRRATMPIVRSTDYDSIPLVPPPSGGTASGEELDLKPFTTDENKSTRSHVVLKQKQRRYGCGLCQETFTRKNDRKRHTMCKHTAERPFRCEGCRKSWARCDKYREHLLKNAACKTVAPLEREGPHGS